MVVMARTQRKRVRTLEDVPIEEETTKSIGYEEGPLKFPQYLYIVYRDVLTH